MTIRPVRPAVAAMVLTLLAATAACGTDEPIDVAQPASPTAAAPTATPSPPPSPSPSSPSAAPSPAASDTIDVGYAGGAVTGDTGRVKVPLGEMVTINVTSDVADEAHLHGYDLSEPIAPGETVTLTFTASIPGVFELELEDIGKQLLSLQVA